MTRKECLDKAAECVLQDRQNQYGKPEDCFGMIAAMWSAYLGCHVSAHDAAAMMALLKIARFRANPMHLDNAVDLAGYAACMAETVTAWEREGQEEQEEGKRDHEFLNSVFAPYAEKPKAEGVEEPKFKHGDKVQVATSEEAKEWHDATYVSFCQMNRDLWRHEVEYADGGRRYVPREWIRPMPKAEGCEALVEHDDPQTKEELCSKILESNPATFKAHTPTGEELAEMAEEEAHG